MLAGLAMTVSFFVIVPASGVGFVVKPTPDAVTVETLYSDFKNSTRSFFSCADRLSLLNRS
jgi:hypothetical protein